MIVDQFLASVETRLGSCVADRADAVDAPLASDAFGAILRLATGGGKRVRPMFVALGWQAAGSVPPTPTLVDIAAAVELLHVSALLHDDVVDGAATRRGSVTAHVFEERRHRESMMAGEARRYGEGVAILAGDLAVALADELVAPARSQTLAQWRSMKSEVSLGQVLDHVATARRVRDASVALRVVHLKTSMYTVVRPLLIGAYECDPVRAETIAGVLEKFGSGVGEAFQLRDDVLGVFGDANDTGKPVGDDVREGKPTWMLAEAVAAADEKQRAVLDTVGNGALDDEAVARVQQVFVDLGVLARAEERIRRRTDDAIAALAESLLPPAAVESLTDTAQVLVSRRS